MWFVVFFASGITGAAWHRLHRRSQLQSDRVGETTGPSEEVGSLVRLAGVSAWGSIWVQACAAYHLTTRRYAPVPMTCLAAFTSSFPTLFGFTFCSHMCAITGVQFLRVCTSRLNPRQTQVSQTSVDERHQRSTMVNAIGFGVGAVGCVVFRNQWLYLPLRGSLTVFGASPKLDTCASRERYFVTKLLQYCCEVHGGVKSFKELASGKLGINANSFHVAEAADVVSQYANNVLGVRGVVSNVESVYGDWAKKYIREKGEHDLITNKLKYTKGTEKVGTLVSTPVRLEMTSKDLVTAFQSFKADVGNQIQVKRLVLCIWSFAGFMTGYEMSFRLVS